MIGRLVYDQFDFSVPLIHKDGTPLSLKWSWAWNANYMYLYWDLAYGCTDMSYPLCGKCFMPITRDNRPDPFKCLSHPDESLSIVLNESEVDCVAARFILPEKPCRHEASCARAE